MSNLIAQDQERGLCEIVHHQSGEWRKVYHAQVELAPHSSMVYSQTMKPLFFKIYV